MDSIKSTKARHDDDDLVDITLRESSENSEPNPNCDDSNPDFNVTCENISLGECCQGEENELFDSAENNQADGRAGFTFSTGSNDDPCRQITTSSSSSDKTCLAGGSSGMAITGARVEGSEDGGIAGSAKPAENSTLEIPKDEQCVRVSLHIATQIGICTTFLLNPRLGRSTRSW